jgi:hypothetical protein
MHLVGYLYEADFLLSLVNDIPVKEYKYFAGHKHVFDRNMFKHRIRNMQNNISQNNPSSKRTEVE